jgi:ubiquinol-cytochrome c reductase cytochrome b subunit
MIERLRKVALWIDDRVEVSSLFKVTAGHAVPRKSGSWFYVFGSGTLLCFMVQIVTGICLALVYVPSSAMAYTSLEHLNYQQEFGWFLRAMHYWGSNFMVAIMLAHLIQVFLFGAFKYPREMTWISGVILLLCTLGMAFTGQILRFDQDAYWGLGIGAAMAGRVPFMGPAVVHMMLGGPIIAGETLSRFFTLHVFVIPGTIIAIVSLHLRLVLSKGINEYPVPGKLVKKETYAEEYEAEIKKTGVPFFPKAVSKDLVFCGLVLLGIVVCSAYFGPEGPHGIPDPTQINTAPKPDFFFLWIYAILSFLPDYTETFLILTVPFIVIGILFAVPFISNTGEKSPRRRPVAVLSVVLIFIALSVFNYLGTFAPWSPKMEAWTSVEVPANFLEQRSPLELQGSLVFHTKQCINCHSVGGNGGLRGPKLDDVAIRLTGDQLVRQVIQGSGNMPAYGKNLSPAEVAGLVAFMRTLHSSTQSPARDTTQPGQAAMEVDQPKAFAKAEQARR